MHFHSCMFFSFILPYVYNFWDSSWTVGRYIWQLWKFDLPQETKSVGTVYALTEWGGGDHRKQTMTVNVCEIGKIVGNPSLSSEWKTAKPNYNNSQFYSNRSGFNQIQIIIYNFPSLFTAGVRLFNSKNSLGT